VPRQEVLNRRAKNRDQDEDTTDIADASGGSHSRETARSPSRVGKKPVTAYVETTAHRQLRFLGLDLDKSVQVMVVEALNDYFERHGLERLA